MTAFTAAERVDLVVTTLADSGTGSLREAIINANAREGFDRIVFDGDSGPFGPPVTIRLESALPTIQDELEIDGYIEGHLWRKAGATIDGQGKHRIFKVSRDASFQLRNLTIANGKAFKGGAIHNRGRLVSTGVLYLDNSAWFAGGAIANGGGDVIVINNTFTGNQSRFRGGAIANGKGSLSVTNSTFAENHARKGGGISNAGALKLNNTIVANGKTGSDCYSISDFESFGTHNIIEVNDGCPGVLWEADPGLGRMDYFNGMTMTYSLAGLSLAINSGDNASALDEFGAPLVWDQRGNGDPRFVAGITDIGAFEVQAFPRLVVDTLEDGGPQGCSGMRGDCPLRAAIRLAGLDGKDLPVTFDPAVFTDGAELMLIRPLEAPEEPVVVDAESLSHISIQQHNGGAVMPGGDFSLVTFKGVTVIESDSKSQ